MDCDVAGYKQSRYDEIRNEMNNMLVKVGWKKEIIGNNLLKKSDNMPL